MKIITIIKMMIIAAVAPTLTWQEFKGIFSTKTKNRRKLVQNVTNKILAFCILFQNIIFTDIFKNTSEQTAWKI